MAKNIRLDAKEIPVDAECDVLVCGAGMAGVCAAAAAARGGAETILLERWACLGGMATAALVNMWHTSDRVKPVIGGLPWEILERGERAGFCKKLEHFPREHETHYFNSHGMKLVLDEFVADSKVQVRCYSPLVDCIKDADRLIAAVIGSKMGLRAIKAKIFIDATGDGDLAAFAGLPFEYGRPGDGLVQGMTLMYRVGGIKPGVVHRLGGKRNDEIIKRMGQFRDEGKLPAFGGICLPCYADGFPANMNPASGNPLDEWELTACHAKCRRQTQAYIDFWRREVPGYENAFLLEEAFAMGVRESRRIRGIKQLTKEDVLGCREQEDAVGHGCWMIDIHDPRGTGYTTWMDREKRGRLPAGRSYHIPFGMLVAPGAPNFLMAGRCASATHEGLSSVRVQSHCAVMGHGAGAAAALALDRGCAPRDVNIAELQGRLKAAGAYIEKT